MGPYRHPAPEPPPDPPPSKGPTPGEELVVVNLRKLREALEARQRGEPELLDGLCEPYRSP